MTTLPVFIYTGQYSPAAEREKKENPPRPDHNRWPTARFHHSIKKPPTRDAIEFESALESSVDWVLRGRAGRPAALRPFSDWDRTGGSATSGSQSEVGRPLNTSSAGPGTTAPRAAICAYNTVVLSIIRPESCEKIVRAYLYDNANDG